MRADGNESLLPSAGAAVGSPRHLRSQLAAPVALPELDALQSPARYLAQHSRSFRFSASMMARDDRARVARVYAWCRYTDNLVDGDVGSALAERRLATWLDRSQEAYEGRDCGIPLVNHVMTEMAERAIPFAYARDLVRAMQSDLQFATFADLDALRVYMYRAAGVVGRWLTELHGVDDSWMLDRATALGNAMQLTNILRDVGEDLARGRVYLPVAELCRHGLSLSALSAIHRGARPIDDAYRSLMEELMSAADEDYELADAALPYLPRSFGRAAAVASAVYRGIHREIRRNDYDNFTRRAYTSGSRKIALALGALASLGLPRPLRPTPA